MPFDPEFKNHLHSLMVEIYEQTANEIEQHRRELVFKAQQTHNSAAMPIAYKDAALHALEFRIRNTIEKYIEAVSIWGYSIDAVFEKDMIAEFWSLTAGPNQIQFPPMIKRQNVQAVQGSYARERAQVASRLVRQGTNRLRELKMKMRKTNRTESEVDLKVLAKELAQLRIALQQSVATREDARQLGIIAEAEEAAESGDGPKVMTTLSKAAKTVWEAAERIGTDIAAKVIVESSK